MSNEVLFYTQLVSIIAYVGSLFYLYQVLVSGKDATIQLLKEKNDWLQNQLEVAKQNTPDAVALSARWKVATEEIERLFKDKELSEVSREHLETALIEMLGLMNRVVDTLERMGKEEDKRLDQQEALLNELVGTIESIKKIPPTS